jgi:hypothetical protein
MQVHKLDEDELYHTVPGFESDIPLYNPPRTASETTYATYARVSASSSDMERLNRAVERATLLTPEEVFAISVRTGIHNLDGSLTEMYREPGQSVMIEDVYGKVVPAPPNYPTLDGLSFEEWDKKHTKQVPEKVQVECRGEFVVGYVCTECDRVRYGRQCLCGSSNAVPIVLKRPK